MSELENPPVVKLAVDFDGVIHDDKNPKPGRRMGPPIPNSQPSMRKLKEIGYTLIVFCRWADSEKNIKTIADWLAYFDIPYDEITNIKPDAVAYIDDKAIKFTTWEEVMEDL